MSTADLDAMNAEHGSVTHRCPVPFADGGDGLFPCCGKTPFEVPSWHRMTLDLAQVTCSREPESAPVAQAGEKP